MVQALQFVGSLAAVLALAWFARRLGLGGDPRLRDPAEVRRWREKFPAWRDVKLIKAQD